jgi:ATP-dependent DNA ligase
MVPTLPRNLPGHEYLTALSEAFDFSICTTGKQVPTGPDWLHEVKYDGYRMMLHRDGDRVPLLTKGGHDGSSRIRSSLRPRSGSARSSS